MVVPILVVPLNCAAVALRVPPAVSRPVDVTVSAVIKPGEVSPPVAVIKPGEVSPPVAVMRPGEVSPPVAVIRPDAGIVPLTPLVIIAPPFEMSPPESTETAFPAIRTVFGPD